MIDTSLITIAARRKWITKNKIIRLSIMTERWTIKRLNITKHSYKINRPGHLITDRKMHMGTRSKRPESKQSSSWRHHKVAGETGQAVTIQGQYRKSQLKERRITVKSVQNRSWRLSGESPQHLQLKLSSLFFPLCFYSFCLLFLDENNSMYVYMCIYTHVYV